MIFDFFALIFERNLTLSIYNRTGNCKPTSLQYFIKRTRKTGNYKAYKEPWKSYGIEIINGVLR